MQKFCKKCGQKLDEKTGLCPDCDKSMNRKEKRTAKKEYKKAAKKEKKAEKWAQLTMGQKIKRVCLKILIVVLILLLLTGGATGALVYFDIVNIPVIAEIFDFLGIKNAETEVDNNNNSDIPSPSYEEKNKELEELDKEIEKALSELENTPIDADAYFQSNSTVISETEVNSSNTVHSETEAYNNLNGRGFTGSVETEYSMSGEYCGTTVISDTSPTKHPIYQTTYVTDNGDIWSIFEINGVVMADPVSYNLQSESGVQVLISETEAVISYDSRKNKFYETIPNESEVDVKTVSRIDAETIENLTYGEIDRL